MVMLIEHIDAIARQQKRDVLFLTFAEDGFDFSGDWKQENSPRSIITKWLDDHSINWKMCADFASENGWSSYQGQIYIDLEYNVTDPLYQQLQQFLEDENEEIRPEFVHTKFYVCPLDMAMTNAHHDEPGFWEEWAENF